MRTGFSLLQQVRGRYLSTHDDVPALFLSYVRLLDQLGIMSQAMKTCKVSPYQNMMSCINRDDAQVQLTLFCSVYSKLQARMLYEGHSALHHLLKRMQIDSSETRAAEMRFAGGLELAWYALHSTHNTMEEYSALDAMESWFQHAVISEKLADLWKLLDATFIAFRDELDSPVEPFVALNDSLSRVLLVPGQAEVARRQVQRADQLEHPKLFRTLVSDLGSGTSLLYMKPVYIEEFMEAMQKVCYCSYLHMTLLLTACSQEMNQHPSKSQTYKLYDERLQQLYLISNVLPPVNEFDTSDIRQTNKTATSESPPGSVFRGRTTSGDLVSIKMLTAFSSTEKAREVSAFFR